MGAEHDDNLNDGDNGVTDLVPITPLSSLFPEITEEEAHLLDGETAMIAERRSYIMTLYRRRMSMRAIAELAKCSLGTVHRDIHVVLEGYKRIAARAAKDHIADMLQRLAHREAQIEEDLDRSRGEFQETSTSRRSTANGTQDQAVVKKRTKYGDPRLHALLQGYWDRRCKLLALLNPADFGKGDLPPVKIISGGIDPAELV
jgi:hypothetical protein